MAVGYSLCTSTTGDVFVFLWNLFCFRFLLLAVAPPKCMMGNVVRETESVSAYIAFIYYNWHAYPLQLILIMPL